MMLSRSAMLRPLFTLAVFACVLSAGGSGIVFAEGKAAPINEVGKISGRIAECWSPPRMVPARAIEVTVRLSFSRDGAVIGKPRIVHIQPAEPDLRERITASVLNAITACTPLSFTPALGAGIAGRILVLRFRSLPLTGRQLRAGAASLGWNV